MKNICRILIPALLMAGLTNFLSINAIAGESGASPSQVLQNQPTGARSWTGVIVDSNGEAIPGVAVFVVGNTTGAAICQQVVT